MIVSREHRFVFVEAPFTGSTAIAKELTEQYGCEKILDKHSHLREFLNQANSQERRYTVAIGVRHPLDQLLSHYMKQKNNHLGNYTTPERFVENGGWVDRVSREQYRFIQDTGDDFAAYLKRFYLHGGVRISQYAWGRSRYDYLIRFESLDQSFRAFLTKVGVEPSRALPRTNPTRGRDREFLSAYPAELHAELRAAFGPLVAEWGYELPDDWAGAVPLSNRVAYALKNLAGRIATQGLRLTPKHYRRIRARLTGKPVS